MFNDCLEPYPSFNHYCFYFIFWTVFFVRISFDSNACLLSPFPPFYISFVNVRCVQGFATRTKRGRGRWADAKFTKELAFWAGNVQHAPVKVSHFACDM